MADDFVSINITEMIAKLSPIQPERCICKVPSYLRKVDEQAYEPHQLAIGAYHRGKVHLEAMEEHKLRYLQKLLEERKEINDVSKYVKAMKELETRARDCYTDPVNLESDDFVKMMLLDGCFIVQLIRMYFDISLRVDNDPIFEAAGLSYFLCRDLLLLENQIPFFVVLELLGMIGISDKEDFTRMILEFLKYTLPDSRFFEDGVKSINEIRHLLDLIHEYWRPSPIEIAAYRNAKETDTSLTRCATELKEAGIKFKKVKGQSLFDIKYEKGTLKIPTLEINDWTNYLLRNLIALEQLSPYRCINHITDYTVFMDCLINSAKDVEILTHCGIVDINLGDDEAAATMFNRLTDSVFYSSSTYYYREVSDEVNAYCRKRQNKWLANLNHNYFNSPWALVSVLAAAVIVLLTLMQTIFSGIAL
ncbi:UPF0481 protein At3g47200-like [Durio zibethinus]|uniref:UPF0481 protein At3g47200-like n=1 Tax=Durio zibethinus TaxID=66656 RepID=A0A6P5X1N8_DURZI|nr:UPF0481 protein At3g47200-like [Durio zibethinus]